MIDFDKIRRRPFTYFALFSYYSHMAFEDDVKEKKG